VLFYILLLTVAIPRKISIMYESNNKKVEKIVNLIQSHGCIVEGKKISLDDLPLLCQDLNDSDKKEVADLIQSIDDELFHLYGERQYLNAQIQPLKLAKEKLSDCVQTISIDNCKNSNPAHHWFVHNWESESFFPTQAEAIAQATSDLTYCQNSDDGSWTDYVEDIYLGFVTHQVKPSAGGYSLRSTLDNDLSETRLCQALLNAVFTERELATMLAGLRSIQFANTKGTLTMPHFDDCYPLSPDEIDVLCERLNR
jgi:hypothetical protein